MEETKSQGIEILSIVLVETIFRINAIDENNKNLEYQSSIKHELKELEKDFQVILTLDAKSEEECKISFESSIKMAGHFRIINDKPDYYNEFCYINAPAIIYPYIRETLASLALKAGIPGIILPTFNFVAFGKNFLEVIKKEISQKNSN